MASVELDDGTSTGKSRDVEPVRARNSGGYSAWYAVIVIIAVVIFGVLVFGVLARSPGVVAPHGLTWFWNPSVSEGGSSLHPTGWNIMWGQSSTTQTYDSNVRCALSVPGRSQLIAVDCNKGSWSAGSTNDHPNVNFVVVSGNQSAVFAVNSHS
jgi:hypothetical protein